MKENFDVVIIGSGIIGSAVARELSKYQLKIAVLEKNLDVCYGTSGRNSAVIHGGFAYEVGTLKAECCVEGCLEFDGIAKELDIPFKRTGKVLVGNTPEDYQSLLETIEIGKKNGSMGLEMIDKEQLHELVPTVVGEFAMLSKMSGIVDPFQYTIALAENAKMNGVEFYFDHEVVDIDRKDGHYSIKTTQDEFNTRWVVNCAGLGSVKISGMLGIHGYELGGSKGDYIILDKKTGPLLPLPVYPVPTTTYMGIHLTPTMDGNVIIGPNADYVEDFDYYGVPQKNMDFLAEDASNLWPHIHKKDYIRNYSGIQPKWKEGEGALNDFVIEAREEAPNSINLIGIESPGLTSAIPIARRAVKLLLDREENISPKEDFNPTRKRIIRFSEQSDEKKEALIKANPDYGEIICRCEMITKAEIKQAIHNPLGIKTMTGIKYRTRSMMGRCQGGYCQMRIAQMIQEELGEDVGELLYARKGSNMFVGKVRE